MWNWNSGKMWACVKTYLLMHTIIRKCIWTSYENMVIQIMFWCFQIESHALMQNSKFDLCAMCIKFLCQMRSFKSNNFNWSKGKVIWCSINSFRNQLISNGKYFCIRKTRGTELQKLSKCEVNAWLCWNLIILPPLWFYVKSNFGELKGSKNVIFGYFRLWTLHIW